MEAPFNTAILRVFCSTALYWRYFRRYLNGSIKSSMNHVLTTSSTINYYLLIAPLSVLVSIMRNISINGLRVCFDENRNRLR